MSEELPRARTRPKTTDDPWHSGPSAAKYTGKNYDHLRRLRRNGGGPKYKFVKATGRYWYRQSWLDAWLTKGPK